MELKPCRKCDKCVYPLKKDKKYKSFTELLFDRKISDLITRGNTRLPYRDTAERIATQRARVEYSKRIDKSGNAACNPPWYFPTVDYYYPKPDSFY